jgi:hypothetical protein
MSLAAVSHLPTFAERKLNPAQIRLMHAFERNVPAIMIGSPGVGKSAMPEEVARDLGIGYVDKRLSICESVDLRGNPIADHKELITRWFPPADMPFVGSESRFPAKGILVLEEINACDPAVQVAAYQLADVKRRGCGEHKLLPGWYVCATGNKITDGAGAKRMNAALGNRFMWIDVEPELASWCSWAMANGIPLDLVGYMRWRGVDALFKMPKDAREFQSPRSWENASRFMDLERAERYPCIAGCVGHGGATDLEGFLEIKNELEPVPYILANPLTAKVPGMDRLGVLYAVTMAVAAAIDKRTARAGCSYAQRLPAEFRALFAQAVLMRDKALATYGFASLVAGEKV